MPLSQRRVQVVLTITLFAAVASLVLSVVNWVQAENTRDAQATELVLMGELLGTVAKLEEVEARIDGNTGAVRAFVEEVRLAQQRGPSPATLRIYNLVEDLAEAHGLEVPPPVTTAPTTTTTTPG